MCSSDLTFAAIAQVKIPAGQCSDSQNLLPALLGETQKGRETFVAHNGGIRGPFGVRVGQWKLVQPGAGGGYGNAANPKAAAKNPAQAQLFDLSNDLGEEKNLAATQPEKLKEMQATLAKLRGEAK